MTSPNLSTLPRWHSGTLFSLPRIERGLCATPHSPKEYLFSPFKQLLYEGLQMSLQLMMNDAWPLDPLLWILCNAKLIRKISARRLQLLCMRHKWYVKQSKFFSHNHGKMQSCFNVFWCVFPLRISIFFFLKIFLVSKSVCEKHCQKGNWPTCLCCSRLNIINYVK